MARLEGRVRRVLMGFSMGLWVGRDEGRMNGAAAALLEALVPCGEDRTRSAGPYPVDINLIQWVSSVHPVQSSGSVVDM